MKRVCYIGSGLLFIAWIAGLVFLHGGAGKHIFILSAVILWIHGLISISDQKKYMFDESEKART
jgi:hypothetical protein